MNKWTDFFHLNLVICIFLILPLVLPGQETTKTEDLDFSPLIKHKAQYYKKAGKLLTQKNETNSPARAFDAVHYKLQIKVYYDPDEIEGKVTIRGKPYDTSISVIELDFHDRLQITGTSANIESYEHTGFLLRITLDQPAEPDSIFSFDISYRGSPLNEENSYFQFDTFPDGSRSLWTLSESYGAKYWWPCKDTPQDKADSVDIIITVPGNQYAVSNGTLVSTLEHGDSTTYHWKERYPIVTYLVSLAIGSYAHYSDYYHYGLGDSMLLDYYVFPEYLEEAKVIFSEMHDFLDGLSYYLGDYPFLREKYGHAQFGWGGGMEHQTITSIGRVSSSIGWKYLYVHELGHQWFGDMLTCASWSEIWLNEGFASYTEALYAEWAGFIGYPPGKESYHVYMSYQKYLEGGTIFVSDTTDESNIFNRIVYDKGSWVLHMLRKVMGDEDFFTALRQYLNDQRWTHGSVTTDNFRLTCEQVSGLSLAAYFDQWLFHPYYPRYEYFWEAVNNKNLNQAKARLTILQKQASPVYEMPVDINFQFDDNRDTTITVQNDQAEQTYDFILDGIPIAMYFDPEDWILKTVTEIPGEPYTDKLSIRKIYPNPAWEEITIEVINWDHSQTKLQIYDILGGLVTTIHPRYKRLFTEFYIWDGRNAQGNQVASGTYILRPILKSGEQYRNGSSKKLVLTH